MSLGDGELPEGWRRVSLGSIAHIEAGQSPPSSTYNKRGEGLPFFQGKAEFGKRSPTARVWCSQPVRIAESGDILLSVRAPVGPTNIASQRSCIGRGLAAIRGTAIDQSYLATFLEAIIDDWLAEVSGSTFDSISARHIRERAIPLPPLDEQRRIVSALTERRAALEALRMQSHRELREVGALAKGVTALAIGPGVRLPSDTVAPPSGWRWRPLVEVARLESGHTPSRKRPDWWGGDVPWLALPDIRKLHGTTAEDTAEHTNEQGLANSSARLLPEGTVCMSRTASVGFSTRLGRPMATSQDFVNWVCGPDLDSYFLLAALVESGDYLRSVAEGAIHKTIYVPAAKALQVCMPPLMQQQAAVDALGVARAQMRRIAKPLGEQIMDYDALDAALLRAAFSGQL